MITFAPWFTIAVLIAAVVIASKIVASIRRSRRVATELAQRQQARMVNHG